MFLLMDVTEFYHWRCLSSEERWHGRQILTYFEAIVKSIPQSCSAPEFDISTVSIDMFVSYNIVMPMYTLYFHLYVRTQHGCTCALVVIVNTPHL
jgi:hypothetical protein